MPVEHIQKIGIAAGVQLVGTLQFHAAFLEQIRQGPMDDRGPHLGFNIIADKRQISFFKALGPFRIAGDKHRDVIEIVFKKPS